MLYDIVVEFLGPCPQGLEFIYLLFSFILLLVGFLIVILIFSSIFKIFRKGR